MAEIIKLCSEFTFGLKLVAAIFRMNSSNKEKSLNLINQKQSMIFEP